MTTTTPLPAVDYWRQLDLLPPRELMQLMLTLIGVGGIGSHLALNLAKMGVPRMTLYDADAVEAHNLPSQHYRRRDVGTPKVAAMQEIISDYAPTVVTPVSEFYTGQVGLAGVVISGVDSMAARQTIWDAMKYNIDVPLYIEARMGAQVLSVHAINPCDIDHVRWYEPKLYSDATAVEDPCTARSIIYTVAGSTCLISDLVKRHVRGEKLPKRLILDMVNFVLITEW